MRAFIRLMIAVTALLGAVLLGADLVLTWSQNGDSGRPYRVEAQRIAHHIENGEDYSLADYRYIIHVEKLSGGFAEGDSDYLIKEIDGVYYRFDYRLPCDNGQAVLTFNVCFAVAAVLVLGVLGYVYVRILRPFDKLRHYPAELAKGHLTIPLKEEKNRYFGQFLWGLDLLRETLESRKASELALQKQNNTLFLSLSHDIKTPLSVIELYAKALEKGLYRDEEKKKSIAVSIHDKCEDIRRYVDDIARTAGETSLAITVTEGEFYLSALVNSIRLFYADKLRLLKTDFRIADYPDCILSGDEERSVEVLQNIIENAVKYGDGERIELSFSREEDCQCIHITNSGCTLSEAELLHIFDSFWRGSNVGTQSGSGLGLYICRTIMHKMNGGIYANIQDTHMTVTVVFQIK